MRQVHNPAQPERGKRSGRKGAVLVELALILPFLALLLVIIADLGLVLREHQVIVNAAREGARFSALPKNWVAPQNPGASLADIQQYVVDYCAESGVTIAVGNVAVDQTVSFSVGGINVGASEVTVTVNRQLLLPSVVLLSTPSVDLAGRAVFRNLY